MDSKPSMAKQVFDFRMDIQSWLMIVSMIAAFALVVLRNNFGTAAGEISMINYFLMGILITFLLIAMCTIPVFILCYFAKRIPDIDYAVWLATIITLITVVRIIYS